MVLLKRLMPSWIASSKLFFDEEEISDVLAMLMSVSPLRGQTSDYTRWSNPNQWR
jgi:hypothetical protein